MYACPWNEENTLVEGSKTSYRGRITVMSNGDTHIKAYRDGSQGSLYKVIYHTEHCRVKLYNSGRIVEEWSFDKKLSIHDIWAIRKREMSQVNSFFQSMK